MATLPILQQALWCLFFCILLANVLYYTMSKIKIRLTWSRTGDFFDIQAANNDFAIWFLQQFDQKSTGFVIEKSPADVSLLADKLTQNLNEVNLFLHQLKFDILPVPQNLLDQKNLNLDRSHFDFTKKFTPRKISSKFYLVVCDPYFIYFLEPRS